MGTVSLYTFVAGSVPTASQWNQNPVAIAAVINGEIDEANIQTADSDGVVGMSVVQTTGNSNPITGNKSFSGTVDFSGSTTYTGTVTVGVNGTGKDVQFFGDTAGKHMLWDESEDELKLVGGAVGVGFGGTVDAAVGASGAEYTTIQAADDALDAAAGYILRVFGSQTYSETVTVSTNDNVIYIDPLTVITSLVLSGDRNTVIMGASCQFTGNVLLDGDNNVIRMGQNADFDGDVTLSGTANELHLGAGSNLASTKTMLLSGANSKCIAGNEAVWPGIISLTGDDTYLEIGSQSVVTGVTGLVTGSGQVLRCGNEVQLIGNITQSAADSEIHMGSRADIDGTVAISGQDAVFRIGHIGNLNQTLNITANGAVIDLGHRTQIVGALTISGGQTQYRQGANANIDGAVIIGTSASVKAIFEGGANFASTIVLSGTKSYLSVGPTSVVTGAVTASGADSAIRAGAKTDFDGIVTLQGVGCSLICDNGCDLDGIVASGASFLIDGGGHDTLVNGTTANHAISVTAANGTIKNTGVQTTAGGGSDYDCISSSAGGAYLLIQNVIVRESDDHGFHLIGDFAKIMFCEFLNVGDGDWILFGGDRYRILGCHFGSGPSGNTVKADAEGDKGIIVANLAEDTNSTFNLLSGADNSLIVGNITDLAIVDSSTSSTVANNEEY